jgi:hypothetical protein
MQGQIISGLCGVCTAIYLAEVLSVFAESKHESQQNRHNCKAAHAPLECRPTSVFFLRLHASCTKIFKLLVLLHLPLSQTPSSVTYKSLLGIDWP